MRQGRTERRRFKRRRLGNGDVLDGLAVMPFLADIHDDILARGQESTNSKGREKPGRTCEKVVSSNGMKEAISAGPRAGWRSGSSVEDFTACTGRQAEVHTAGIAGDRFERSGASLVVGAGDAAGGAGESDIRERCVALQGCERLL